MVFDGLKGTLVAILYVIFSVSYLGVLNPKSKLHIAYEFFELGKYSKYSVYIEYFTSFMVLALLLSVIFCSFILNKRNK